MDHAELRLTNLERYLVSQELADLEHVVKQLSQSMVETPYGFIKSGSRKRPWFLGRMHGRDWAG